MTELEQIAASVAKALNLGPETATNWQEPCWLNAEGPNLLRDGSNLFSEYWQVRCRDWLLEHGCDVVFNENGHHCITGTKAVWITCFASEFCARAIHELMKKA